MNVVSSVFILLGAFVALLAGIGLLTFNTPYARFHAAGKASPIAFLMVAIGAGIEVGCQRGRRTGRRRCGAAADTACEHASAVPGDAPNHGVRAPEPR